MEVPGAKAPDGYGGLSFSGGLLHQELTAQDNEHLGVEMLGDPAFSPRRDKRGESPVSAGVGDDLGARRGINDNRAHSPASTRR